MKVNLINAQKETERIIRDLERGNEKLALARLSELRKSAYNRYYYAEKKLEKEQPTGIDYQLQAAQTKQLKIELQRMNEEINNIRTYIKNPEQYDWKTNRANYYSVQRSFSRVNALVEKKNAEREKLSELQREAGDVVGVTLYNVRKTEKIKALLQNVIYNNKLYNFSEAEILRISNELKMLTGFDLQQELINIFDVPQHYESDGSKSNIPLYDSFVNITDKLQNLSRGYQGETMDKINELINDWLRMTNG